MRIRPARASRRGQIALVLVFITLALAFLLMLVMDEFLAIRGKTRAQNAGDAAALAAARWQGTTLNLIGDLNLAHFAARCDPSLPDETRDEVSDDCVALQERLALAGPALAFLDANRAAKANDAPVFADMSYLTDTVLALFDEIRESLGEGPASWPTKWEDYAAMIRAATAGGVAASCDNANVSFAAGGTHMLQRQDFYEAVAGENWRWFCRFFGDHGEAASFLAGFNGWDDPPTGVTLGDVKNGFFFGVDVTPAYLRPDRFAPDAAEVFAALAEENDLAAAVNPATIEQSGVMTNAQVWYVYDLATWREWSEIDPDGADHFPVSSRVRDVYDVYGASAACRTARALVPFSEAAETNVFAWTGAAKPFGSVAANGGERRVTELFANEGGPQLVVPAFTHARLVPLGGVGESRLGTADPAWLRHLREHPLGGGADCRYCAILAKFTSDFARRGADWLRAHAHEEVCDPPGKDPGWGGGTRHAH